MFVNKLRGGKSRQNKFQIEPLEQRRLLSGSAHNSFAGDSNGASTANAQAFNGLASNYVQITSECTGGDINEDGTVNALDFAALATNYGNGGSPFSDDFSGLNSQPITTLSTKLLKLEGQFSGHYTSTTTGTHAISFDITACTHTGHFTGTAEFTNDAGKFPATVKGVISASHHIDLSYSGADFSGTMTGNATHTNGSFSGDYTNTTGPVSHGTYHVAKA